MEIIKINIPYDYQEQYLPTRRHKYPRTRRRRGEITGSLKKVEGKEFPLAFVVNQVRFDENEQTIIRKYDDKLYVKVRPTASMMDLSDFREYLSKRFQHRCSTDLWDDKKSRSISDDAIETASRVLDELSQYLYLEEDASFWEPQSGEPIYSVREAYDGRLIYRIVYKIESDIFDVGDFSATERDAAIGYVQTVTGLSNVGKFPSISVLIPEAVKCNPQARGNLHRRELSTRIRYALNQIEGLPLEHVRNSALEGLLDECENFIKKEKEKKNVY